MDTTGNVESIVSVSYDPHVYVHVLLLCRLEGRVHRVLCCAPSSLPAQERDVRLFHRYLFLVSARHSDREYAFWLTQILKPWPITFQAKLLYLLTAPEDENGMGVHVHVCMLGSIIT